MIQGINQLKMDDKVELTDNISEAGALLALQSKLKKNSRIQAAAKSHDIPIYVTKVIIFSFAWTIVFTCFQRVISFLSCRHAH